MKTDGFVVLASRGASTRARGCSQAAPQLKGDLVRKTMCSGPWLMRMPPDLPMGSFAMKPGPGSGEGDGTSTQGPNPS